MSCRKQACNLHKNSNFHNLSTQSNTKCWTIFACCDARMLQYAETFAAEPPEGQAACNMMLLECEFPDSIIITSLHAHLQALCIWEAGSTFVPAKPWQPGSCNSTVRDVHLLSSEVQGHLQRLLDEEEWACQNEKHTR